MRSSFASRGLVLVKSPSARQLSARRRAITIGGLLALALGSAAIGALTRSHGEAPGQTHTGPFSYFPSS